MEITGDRKRGRETAGPGEEALTPKTEIGIKSVLEVKLMRWARVSRFLGRVKGRGQERKGAGEVRVRNGVKGEFLKRIQPSGEIERQIDA